MTAHGASALSVLGLATPRQAADSFWSANNHWITAIISVLVALVLAYLIDRTLARRGRQVASAVMRGEISAEADTRLRFIRRLLYAVIILLGIAVGLAQFEGVNRLAASLLASGAIAAAILGFAARQTLANFVAGVMLAVTQPIRVGDWICVEDEYGVVDDIRLTYTFLRTVGNQRIVIPNEKLASGLVRNDTMAGPTVGWEVHVWLPPTADAGHAVRALVDETGRAVHVTETTPEGVRLAITGEPCPPPERAAREAELRLQCLTRLRAEGLLATPE